jgi:AraC-like DNA-binding protein
MNAAPLVVPGSYTSLLLRHVGMSTRVAPIPAVISVPEQLRWVEALNETQPSGWGLDAGMLFDAAAHGPLGVAAVSAPSLERALDVVARYGEVRSPFLSLSVARGRRAARLRIDHDRSMSSAVSVPLLESTVVSVQRLLAAIAGDLHAMRFAFAYDRPAHHARYAQCLAGPVEWGADATSITIPCEYLARRAPLADARLHRTALDLLDEALRMLHAATPVQANVHRLLDRLEPRSASFDRMATELRLSARTLSRRLRAAGTSYRALSDAHRRDLAHRLLTETEVPVGEVARRLGYDDPPNFGRACRRWFGIGPSAYRRKRRAAGVARSRGSRTR